MKIPPAIARVQIKSPQLKLPGFWLPLFLLWPLFVLLAVPILVFTLLSPRRYGRTARAAYDVICALRGTHVDVSGDGSRVLVSIH